VATGVDKFPEMFYRSLQAYLDPLLPGYTGVWQLSPDFNHDMETGAGGAQSARQRPYVGIQHRGEETANFEIGGRQDQRNLEFDVWVVCEDYESLLRRPGQVQQLLRTSTVSGVKGAITLYDFDAAPPSGVGYVEIMTRDAVLRVDPDEKREWRNLKFVSLVQCRVEREKDWEAELPTSD